MRHNPGNTTNFAEVRALRGYMSITNVDVVVYALAILGGAEKPVYSEDIAVKCYELAPSRFSWQFPRYREKGWPDKYIVKTALEDAKKSKNGGLVEGSYALEITRDGWRLTPRGANWFKESKSRIEKEIGIAGSNIPKRAKEEIERSMQAVAKHPLYKKYLENGSLEGSTIYELTDMLNCSPDAPIELITRKFQRLRSMAELMDKKDVIVFLELFYATFPQLGLERM